MSRSSSRETAGRGQARQRQDRDGEGRGEEDVVGEERHQPVREHGGLPEERALHCGWMGARECRQSSEVSPDGLRSRGLITKGLMGHTRDLTFILEQECNGDALCAEMLTQQGDLREIPAPLQELEVTMELQEIPGVLR